MNSTATPPTTERTVIGRRIMARDNRYPQPRTSCAATVIDAVAGTNRSKRVRLQTGEHAGEVRTMGEYTVLEFLD